MASLKASDSPQFSKEKKAINACIECCRRKQKCDRKQPCGNCVARNVTDKCHYSNLRKPSRRSSITGVAVDTRDVQAPAPPDGSPDCSAALESLAIDMGYSSTRGSNAFAEFKQLFRKEDGGHAVSTANHDPVAQTEVSKPSAADARLPSTRAIHKLVEVFFNDVNWQYFIIEEQYFDSLLNCWYGTNAKISLPLSHEELGRELYYFPALLCQVLGLAIQFLPVRSPVWEYLSQADMALCHKYSDTGVELMAHGQRPHAALTVVQADFLRASWLKNIGKGVEAWHSIGSAIRSAQELELHRYENPYKHASSSPGANISRMWYEEYKRRLWMNLYTWDALTSMILGRPRAIHPDDCDVEEPIECNIPPDPSSFVPGSQEVIGGRDRPNTVSSNLFLYRLSNVWHAAKGQKADRPWSIDYSVVQQLHDRVHLIMERLPLTLRHENPDLSWDDQYPYLRYQREDILTKANLMLVALHRPHIKYRAESRRAALQASIVILDSQHRSFIMARPHQYKFFGLSFYTIDASLLLSVVTAKYLPQMDSAVMTKIDAILQQAMNRLSAMHSYSPIARSGLTILSQCYNILQMRLERSTATWYLQKAVATEPRNFAQDSRVDVMSDSLSEQQSHLPLPQSQEHNQQEPVWGAPTFLSTDYSASSRPFSRELHSSESGGTFDTSVDARTIPTTATQPSPYLEPSTTDFDETYWLSMINEVPDVTNTDPTEALEVGPTVEAASMEYNTVWNQIQFSESST